MPTRPTGLVIAAVLSAALLSSGCSEMLKSPPPGAVAKQETVGVDPSGEHLDTSTVPTEDAEDAPLVAPHSKQPSATRKPPRTATRPRPSPQPSVPGTPPDYGFAGTGTVTSSPGSSGNSSNLAASGMFGHRRHYHMHGSGN